jgi:predicted  nucleic acid-binding Zn-ribbon protein
MKNLLTPLLVALALILGVACVALGFDLYLKASEINNLKSAAAELQKNYGALSVAAQTCSQSVQDAKDKADQTLAKAQESLDQAKKDAAPIKAKAKSVLASTPKQYLPAEKVAMPTSEQESCVAANNLLDSAIEGASK